MVTPTFIILFSFEISLENAIDFENNHSLVADSYSEEFLKAQKYLESLQKILILSNQQFAEKLVITTTFSKEKAHLVLVWDSEGELDFTSENQQELKLKVEQIIKEFEHSSTALLKTIDNAKAGNVDKQTEKDFNNLKRRLKNTPTKFIEEYVETCEDLSIEYNHGLDLAEKINQNPEKLVIGTNAKELELNSEFKVIAMSKNKVEIRIIGNKMIECSINPASRRDKLQLFFILILNKIGKIQLTSLDDFKQPKFTKNTVINFQSNSIKVDLSDEEKEDLWNLMECTKFQGAQLDLLK